ncbi:GIY-YIG nuclease family protein [Mucilaginibacter sp. PPCGB 2223]|uniref:GIY-YIG nuclease family protein n=1 Tax=Mucilaginibacter sp. PPCGB 2223 TaxID=1886027 RepID=UPI0020C74DE7|nr:GIY-YIG nuclease family protein [Mucilaginibacter sp. PPCGB 2223]
MLKTHQYFVYILTNKYNTVLYVGVTSNLESRVLEHKLGVNNGFTKRYACNKLVYFEKYQWIQDAITREKAIESRFATSKNQFNYCRQSELE